MSKRLNLTAEQVAKLREYAASHCISMATCYLRLRRGLISL